ncbi:homer protein homolog 3-like isoform X1 [Carassius auratus]|uniref:Homer protein homolog 3-like isoform X1 n=2 Tax=Carassius auratus TaxID=7957 RepID=A0A6P6QEA0_CARAU|nr:homer protein homolog 3-like isoform X1 [Carassius auratus]XP_052424317.1 homer protein homolog 3-like [Carassius gibelio]
MGEQPLFSLKAHVFQIDPDTKRNWIPASKHAVTVSFFYDAARSVYRIISVGGTKAIINSTITPNMTFTKTSQKFGQWADSRANTVYGLGFATEQQLQQFSEQFKEFKESARLVRDKSQEKFELLSPALNISSPQVLCEDRQSPPLLGVNGSSEDKLFRSKSADMEESSEKEQMRKMLSEGSICERNPEAELFSLRDSNAKLVAALHEANSSIDQWKKQLAEYQEETVRLREQVAELEAQRGVSASSETASEELSQTVAEMEALIKAKDEEISILRGKKPDVIELEKEREEACQRMQDLEVKNSELEKRVRSAEGALASSQDARSRAEIAMQKVIETLDVKICNLSDLRQNLAKLLEK